MKGSSNIARLVEDLTLGFQNIKGSCLTKGNYFFFFFPTNLPISRQALNSNGLIVSSHKAKPLYIKSMATPWFEVKSLKKPPPIYGVIMGPNTQTLTHKNNRGLVGMGSAKPINF